MGSHASNPTSIAQAEGQGRRVTAGYRAQDETPKRALEEEGAGGAREPLLPGTKVARYEVIRLIGEGGMGEVYEALDARLHRKVALKILSCTLKSKRKAAKRFSIEAQAAARLVHPNVVGIFDFDVDCEPPYMAMEYLQGETLAETLARGALPFDRLADIMLAVCAGVHAAHQAGIVHRDLKPGNIFLCPDWKGNPSARVLDFGISKVGGISGSGLTETGDIVGTSQYLSPEQAQGLRHIRAASDQYSLGVVMYECVVGHPPQHGEPIYTLLRNITEGRHKSPRLLRPDLPPALEAVIERAMSVREKDRFPSVHDLGCALFPFASAEGRRQFEDFYQPAKIAKGREKDREEGESVQEPTGGTVRLPCDPAPTWQSRRTHTSVSPAAQRADVSMSRQGRSRALLVSVLLGVLVAGGILVGLLLAAGH